MDFGKNSFGRAGVGPLGLVAGAVAAFGLLGPSVAMAQNCAPVQGTGVLGGAVSPAYLAAFASGLSGANAISGAVTAANTAFLTQSTAFVSAPGNPAPNSEGAGVWVRGVGGELTLKTETQIAGSVTGGGTGIGGTSCNSQFHQTFAGVQIGQDIADLNFGSGWNFHTGTTAGFLETSGNITQGNLQGGAFNSSTQAPFLGTYAVLTKGNFYVDGLIRYDYFQTSLNSPTANFFNQQVDASGFTLAISTGYNYKIPNSKWFVEPSVGFVSSRETVGALNTLSPGFVGAGNFSGTTQVNQIQSDIGRAGLRLGTTVETSNLVMQPFVAASVWHDFAGQVTATYASCPNCIFIGGVPSSLTANLSSNNIGTFGQYSVGVAGQLINTGWLGFVRMDYREGPNMNGLSGTGGIRYQFTPVQAAAMPVKAPVYTETVNWTGLYVGAIGGAEAGRGSMYFSNSAFTPPLTQSSGASSSDMRPAGVLGGGTLGYNWQLGHWVYGVEGDAAWTGAQGSSQCQPLNPPLPGGFSVNNSLFQTTCHDNVNWTATAAARLGYAWTPRTLLYAKAGIAIAGESFSETCNLGPTNGTANGGLAQNCVNASGNFVNQASVNTTAVGWTLGYGTEFALTRNWTAKAEFDWLDLGHKSVTLSDSTTINTYQRAAQAKIGVNYKF